MRTNQLEKSTLIKSIYHAARGVLRRTGRDIFRLDTLERLTKELANEKKEHEALKVAVENKLSENAAIDSLRQALDLQRRANEAYRLEKNIIPLRPEKYSYERNCNNDELLMFKATSSTDFDWLEDAIFRYGYYEKLGVWSFVIDDDKRTLAEMVATFQPKRTLDFGCANGPLVQSLADLGIDSEGVDISEFALKNAFAGIRNKIHLGDIVQLQLPRAFYDVVIGLDIFEHLNPNKIDSCIEKIHSILRPGGCIFTNIPAFGRDPIFGEVFEYYMPDWDNQRDGSSYFNTIHADMHGYPVNGHLIWADTKWWTALFQRHQFQRDVATENKLHAQFDSRLYHSRRSFYVFQKT